MTGSSELPKVLRTLTDNGGAVFDTAPSRGDSQQVACELANELGVEETIRLLRNTLAE